LSRDQYIKEEIRPLIRARDEQNNEIWVPSQVSVKQHREQKEQEK